MAKDVFGYMWAGEHGGDADAIIEARGLKQVSDAGAIEKIIDEVLAKNEKSVAEFKSGKDKAIQSLIGQVMKASQGKANPGQVNDLLRKKLAD
jgi:aspartyl-tRNA(Asn)/glutamyl-tRNA(Gln) amidotransferase subunit B